MNTESLSRTVYAQFVMYYRLQVVYLFRELGEKNTVKTVVNVEVTIQT